jgi:hypothetical protein
MMRRRFILSDEAVVEYVGRKADSELLVTADEDTGHWWDTQTRLEDLARMTNTSTETFS